MKKKNIKQSISKMSLNKSELLMIKGGGDANPSQQNQSEFIKEFYIQFTIKDDLIMG